jgi:PST family polysaccharide transporter/lipopolysaccharide exporter
MVLYSLALIGAPWIAEFYQMPDLTTMIRVSLVCTVFNGSISSKTHLAIKRMEYKKWVFANQGGSIFGIATTLALVFFLPAEWALVTGFLVESFSRMVLSYLFFPFLPKFEFDKKSLEPLLKFAKGMFGLPILTFIFLQIDIFVVGKMFSKHDLGIYSMAVSLAQIPAFVISVFINPILMPAFSSIQFEKDKINNSLILITSMLVYVGFPLLACVLFFGKDILMVVYGTKYGVVAVPFALLISNTLIRTCGAPIVNVYLALGKPELHRLFTGMRAAIMLLLIFPFSIWFGLTGTALAGLVAILVAYAFQLFQINRLTGLHVERYYQIFFNGAMVSIPAIACGASTFWMSSLTPVSRLMVGAILISGAYTIIAYQYLWKKGGLSFLT